MNWHKRMEQNHSLKWSEIAKCTVCYIQSYGSGSLFYRVLDIILLIRAKRSKSISIRLSGKLCLNKSVINAIKQFGGQTIYDSPNLAKANNNTWHEYSFVSYGIIIIFAYSIIHANNSRA